MDPRPAPSDDIERLASCLGLLLADGGEGENAARVVRTIARRIGLTGGQLKQMFIAGAATPIEAAATRENFALRQQLSATEIARVAARREVAFLDQENASLRQAVSTAAVTTRKWRGVSLVAATLFVGLGAATTLRTYTAARPMAPATSLSGRTAIVRHDGTMLFETPDSASAAKTPLPAGARLVVRRLLWKTLQQWAEVEVDGRTGYVITTGVDLS